MRSLIQNMTYFAATLVLALLAVYLSRQIPNEPQLPPAVTVRAAEPAVGGAITHAPGSIAAVGASLTLEQPEALGVEKGLRVCADRSVETAADPGVGAVRKEFQVKRCANYDASLDFSGLWCELSDDYGVYSGATVYEVGRIPGPGEDDSFFRASFETAHLTSAETVLRLTTSSQVDKNRLLVSLTETAEINVWVDQD
jgi:hypothetical protein